MPWAAVRIEREVAQAHFTVDPDRLEIVIPQHDAGSLELRIFPARETATTALTRHLRPRVRCLRVSRATLEEMLRPEVAVPATDSPTPQLRALL